MAYVSLLGHRTWVKVPRPGPTVLLLHGGMSSSASMLRSLAPRIKKDFRIAAFDRRGHGRTPDTDEPFHYETMADETIAFIEHLGRPVYLVGHSDGGNVALYVTLRRPDLVRKAVVIGANYHYDGLMELDHMTRPSPEFDLWAMKYAESSPDGIEHAPVVYDKTLAMFASEPTLTRADLGEISRPTLVLAGDDDVATLEHTCSMYEAIPGAQLAIVPGASHALLKERPKESARLIRRFLLEDSSPETLAPVRRARREGVGD
ncbi:MAG: alpha/beta fold hydrolase [Acidobacteria bacterium]|nr:alpha/beta fold hydrolase [Acidobacteriota bacterium]